MNQGKPGQRPFFLNLLAIRLPIGGVVSILHRASGALLALAVPALLYILACSLRSAEDFRRLSETLAGPIGMLATTITLWALLHHLLAGIRHLGFDFGFGETRERARLTAWLTLSGALLLTALVFVGRLW